MVSIETAPRDLEGLKLIGRAQLFMLALKLNIFGGDKPQETAFLQNPDTGEQAQIVQRALAAYDGQAGRAPATATPAQPAAPQPQAPAQPQMPQPAQPGAPLPQAPVMQQPAAHVPVPGAPMQPPPGQQPVPPIPGAVAAAPVQPAPTPVQPTGVPTPVSPNVVGMPPQPQPMGMPPGAPASVPQQPGAMRPMPAAVAPAAQPPVARQPTTAADPTNAGAAVPANMALPNALTGIASALKAVQTGLSQCASKADVLAVTRTQNAILVLLMRLSEPHIGLEMPAMAQMIDAALRDGEPEKWFEGLGGGLGKG